MRLAFSAETVAFCLAHQLLEGSFMRAALRLLGTGLFVSLVVGACGGESDAGIDDQGVPIDDLPQLYAGAACKSVQSCFGALYSVFSGGEDCEKNYATALGDELPRLKQAIEQKKVVYDGTQVKACLAAIEKVGCNLSGEPAECTAAIDGTVEIGGDCELDAECKGSDTLCQVGAACPGKCAKKGLAGAACTHNSDCAAGLSCSEATEKCIQPAAEGAACEGGGVAPECAMGLFCLGSDDKAQKPGSCKNLTDGFSGKSGDACWFQGKPGCATDLRCIVEKVDTTTGQVDAKCGAPFGAGAACKIAIPDGCPTDQYCKVPTNAFAGTCTPRPKAGEPCAKLFDDDLCGADTRCESGTCKPRQKLGGQCSTDDVCFSENCVNDGCAPSGGCK